jgi:nicotinamidase-related amidase
MPAQAGAQNIVDAWKSVAVPPPPPLQAVAVDRAHTALLVLDMNAASCTDAVKPSCFRSIPAVQRLLKDARAHDMLVVFSTGPASSGPAPKTPDALTPLAGEQIVRAGADKFVGSDLEKILAARDIRSIIVTGTSAEGAVLYTASAAALRKMKAIVPVDAYSSANPFAELYTAWHLKNAPSTISSNVTVTKTDMITIE